MNGAVLSPFRARDAPRDPAPPAWKSRGQPGRPKIEPELRKLIRRMGKENPLWGAPRIHGELLKLGFEIAESTVSKYMIRHRGPPSQNWRTFLRNHADAIAAIDLCVVPTLTFECLFAFVVVGHETRTHLGLSKDAPRRRAVQRSGTIVTTQVLSRLHHRYVRI